MKLKRLACAFVAAVMVGSSLNGILPVVAAEEGSSVKNEDSVTLDDGVVLSKIAEEVPGYVNKWKITLRIETPVVTTTSDTVLVIDRSGSMAGVRMASAKTAAESLVKELLPEGNTLNRVAVISYGTNVTTNTGFSASYDTVSGAISGITANGGTFTQGGLHAAIDLVSSSTADYKNIILLSDGAPSFSYGIKNLSTNSADMFDSEDGPGLHTHEYQTRVVDSRGKFDYNTTVGDGARYNYEPEESEMWDLFKSECRNWVCTERDYYYYNHGNAAISEANFYKADAIGGLYTIAFNAGNKGQKILNSMADEGKAYTATESNLKTIFDEIAGEIALLVKDASVHDTMGQGVMVSGTGADSINWTPEFKLVDGKYVAETSYEVEMDESVLNQISETGFYALNKSAVLTYNDGKTGEFPVPSAKPFALDVEKELIYKDADGAENVKNGEKFKFKISGNDKVYEVESGAGNKSVVTMPIEVGAEYTVTEVGAVDESKVKFENYNTSYEGAKFTITDNHPDTISTKIKNVYETTNIAASKKWVDDDNRDGFRGDYDNLYVAVKDGNNFVDFRAINTTDENQQFDFKDLPKYRNGVEIDYEVVEAKNCDNKCIEFNGDAVYTSEIKDGAITNTHVPETTNLTIKKKWDTSAGTLPTVTPQFVTVEVSNDKNDAVEEIILEGNSAYGEWSGEFSGYKYENGEEINYSVKEMNIAGNSLNKENTLYVYNDERVLEGKWVATYESLFEVTNTWTPARTVYEGSGEFSIKKIDQDGEPLAGVTFTVGEDEYITGKDGKIVVGFSKSDEKPEDKYVFKIKETKAPKHYDILKETEVLEATADLELMVDEESLTNTYTKSFDFEVKTAADGYVWQKDIGELVVTNQALADKLKIEKTFEGISAKAFEENSKIDFVVSGPKGFEKMTVGNRGDECTISGNKLTCMIDGTGILLPVGEYIVKESNAGIANFTYTSEPVSGEVKKGVKLGETGEFKFKNVYEPVKTASYKVKKNWEDDGDRDGIRPDKLKVTLKADGEAYGEPVELTKEDWGYEWEKLPLVNKDAEEIKYSAEEENISGYESDGGKMENNVFTFTNSHEPEKYDGTGELEVKKIWTGDGNELVRPGSILVELLANGEVINTASIVAGQNGEWSYTFTGLYKNQNGEEIEYSMQESEIGKTAFDEGSDVIVVYNDDNTIAGSWTRNVTDYEVTNTWTEATEEVVYEGAGEFTVKKVNESGDAMKGVTFTINGEDEKTDEKGLITEVVPVSKDEKEESFEFSIKEKEALKGYRLVKGSAKIAVSCTSEFSNADPERLVNTYVKTCEFEKSGSEKYVWDEADKVLTVVNKHIPEEESGRGGASYMPAAPETGGLAKLSKDVARDNSAVAMVIVGACAVATTMGGAAKIAKARRRK